jgi:hypothetical protein
MKHNAIPYRPVSYWPDELRCGVLAQTLLRGTVILEGVVFSCWPCMPSAGWSYFLLL